VESWNTRALSIENPTFRPQGTKTPEPVDIKHDMGNYVGDYTQHAQFISLLLTCTESPQIAPFGQFLWLIAVIF